MIDKVDVGNESNDTKIRQITFYVSTEFGIEIEEYWRSPFDPLLRRIKTEETNILPVIGEKRRRVQNITKLILLEAVTKRLDKKNWSGFQIVSVGA